MAVTTRAETWVGRALPRFEDAALLRGEGRVGGEFLGEPEHRRRVRELEQDADNELIGLDFYRSFCPHLHWHAHFLRLGRQRDDNEKKKEETFKS